MRYFHSLEKQYINHVEYDQYHKKELFFCIAHDLIVKKKYLIAQANIRKSYRKLYKNITFKNCNFLIWAPRPFEKGYFKDVFINCTFDDCVFEKYAIDWMDIRIDGFQL